MRPGGVDAGVEGHVGALERVEGEGADHVRAADEAQRLGDGEAAHRGHELGPVDEGEALLRLEDERRARLSRAGRRRRAGGGPRRRTRPRRRGRARGGRGAPGPRSPRPSPARGRRGGRRRLSERDQQIEGLEAHAGEALGEHVGPQQHQRSRLGFPERRAHPRRVGAEQVELELPQAVEGDVDVGEVAEAGGDPVDDRAARHRVVDDPARVAARPPCAPRRRARRRRPSRATDSSAGRSSDAPSIGRGVVGAVTLIGKERRAV